PQGVISMNHAAETIFRRKNPIRRESMKDPSVYEGKPILITRNYHDLELYNGDMGMIWSTSSRTGKREWNGFFSGVEGASRRVPLHRIPSYESAFAVTVHKSQGSEFEEILLILPDQDLPLLTRELFYTAVTRGKQRVVICGNEMVIRAMVERRIRRNSGLRDLLW
ncbi:MAG: ATP-binding domain-containing protein, partial [Thermodesulfobacteriota bacterium]